MLHKTLLIPVLLYGSEKKIWRKKEKYRVNAVQRDNPRGMLGIRRMDSMSNVQIRGFLGVTNREDERIDMCFPMVQLY